VTELRIGILVDSALKHQYLSKLVQQAGHQLGCAHDLSVAVPALAAEAVDAWLVDVREPDDHEAEREHHMALRAFLDDLLEQSRVPVIVNDASELTQGSAEYQHWVRRMLQRLERLSGDINLQTGSRASEVWVLGASTGGPAAVKDFLQHLPAKLNVAFLYVQHIDSGQAQTLVKMMGNAGHYPVRIAKRGLVLVDNTITLISADYSVNVHDNGTLLLTQTPWGGCYSPSIDQVAANVARVYRQRSGMIIFSGMGDDGAASSRLIKQQGGKVWVQTPAQSTIAAMPEAAIATGAVSFIGTPPELAQALGRLKPIKKTKQH
jgi:chemosensory pili system protein ChpB (putative protein-glutamate methylesterase)